MKIKNVNQTLSYFILCLLIIGFGCRKQKYDLPDQPLENYNKVYMPGASNGPITKTLKVTDSIQSLTYGANFGGQGYPEVDIPVTFTVDTAKVDSFNRVNRTSYKVLPKGSYTLESTSSIIPKGQLRTPALNVSFKTTGTGSLEALKTYLLPITVSNNVIKVNEDLRTMYYIVKAQPEMKDYPNYARTQWQVMDFSSQEANGEGPNNGRAIFALDGSTATFWHTQWQGATPAPPHHLVINMGEVKTMHGLSLMARQGTGAGKPNEVNVQLSMDNLTWTNAGTFTLLNTPDAQPQFLPEGFNKPARYFKVVINSAYSASYSTVAELNAF